MKKQKKKSPKILTIPSNILILGGLCYLFILYYPILKLEIQYQLKNLQRSEKQLPTPSATPAASSSSVKIIIYEPLDVTPVSTTFGLIIEKIDLNVYVQPDVDITTKEGYWKALENGVAHAKGTKYPGQIGNTYLFAHSTVNPLEINKYNAVFTLLNKLEHGDRITTFYEGTRYDYIVETKEIVDPTDVSSLTRDPEEPILTLQTCHPPGTNLKRLIVTAKIEENR